MQNWRFRNSDALQNLLNPWRKRAGPLLPGVVTALAVTALLKLGVFQPLEQIAYRSLFQLRGATDWDERVVVVAIDDASITALGRFPWARQRYTQLLKVLTVGKASTVTLDIVLTEPSADDIEMAAAMLEQGRVILPQVWGANGELLQPTPTLAAAAVAFGHIDQQQDSDNLVRTVQPQIEGTPTLAIATTQVYSLVRDLVPLPPLNRSLWINWAGPVGIVPTYSFNDVLTGRIDPAVFQDKIVVVGITATGFDALATPFDHNPDTTNVYYHATTIHNLLQRNFLQVPPGGWVVVGLWLEGLGLSALLWRWSGRQKAIGLAGLGLAWGVVCLLLFRANVWMPVASPLVTAGLTTAAVAFRQRLHEDAVFQQEVERLWKTYRQGLVVPTGMAPTLVPHPEETFLQSNLALRMTQLSTLAEQFGRSQSTQAAIARSLSIGLVAANLEGWVWFCNPIAVECLGVQVGDRLQYHLIPEWFTPEQWQAGMDQLSQQLPFVPHEVQRDDRWFEIRLEPLSHVSDDALDQGVSLKWSDDAQPGALLLLEDITARKQVEENISRQMQELQRINQLKDDFLNAISHDMRAPLSNMTMAIRMLQVASSDVQRQRYLHILEVECLRETNLIEDLLSLQQLEAGAKELILEEINMMTWLPQLLEPFQQRTQARNQKLSLRLMAQPAQWVCDRSGVERILVELVNNACKYTPPEGEIVVTVDVVNTWVRFIVSNSGAEIPAAEVDKVFDKFYRVANGDRWQQGGTGLGLALVKKLVEQLGGNIHLTSQFEQTTFTVQLPLRPQPGSPMIDPRL
jgi:signal transduction histidine kinase/CHASE2 domain-containing sensor protein